MTEELKEIGLNVHSSVVTDEKQTLSKKITLFGPTGADVRHLN
jgi:hypothetical protein